MSPKEKQSGRRISLEIYDKNVLVLLDGVPRAAERSVVLRDLLTAGLKERGGFWQEHFYLKDKGLEEITEVTSEDNATPHKDVKPKQNNTIKLTDPMEGFE